MLWWALRQLKSSDVEIRRLGMQKLGRYKNHKVVTSLVTALSDSDIEVRRNAVQLLSRIVGEPKTDGIGLSQVREDPKRQAVRLDTTAVEPLIAMLGDDDSVVRVRVVTILGTIGDIKAVESLVTALSDSDGEVRRRSAIALDKLGWEPQDDRQCALRAVALGRWHETMRLGTAAVEPLSAVLRHGGWTTRQQVVEALGIIGDVRAVESLIMSLADSDRGVRRRAVRALRMIGMEAVEPLIAALHHSDREVRRQVAEVLGTMKDGRVVKPLVAALGDSDNGVRWQAAEALGKMGEEAVEPLVAVLGESGSGVRWWAAAALEQIGTGAVDSLMKVLIAEKWEVRQQAAEVLGTIQDARAIEPLAMALGDSNDGVRRRAATALEKFGWTPQDQQQKALYAVVCTSRGIQEASAGPLSNSSEHERSIV